MTSEPPTILVADDNVQNRRLLQATFRAEGWCVRLVADGEAAIASVRADLPSIVLLDLHMPGLDGLDTLAQLRALAPGLPILMLTAHGDIAVAVEATKRGAYDFLTRPIDGDELVLRISRAMEHRALEREVQTLRRSAGGALSRIVGRGAATRALVSQIQRVASSPMTVLVLGETGTGKELVARALHHESARRQMPFVAIDCGAIPDTLLESELFGHEAGAFSGATKRREGRFAQARGGTVFLDEIGNLPLLLQAKLLRVLQEREVHPLGAARAVPLDVRFIAATNESLEGRIDKGLFREDLYYRLAETTLVIPPLRERPDDITDLAAHFLDEAAVELHRPITGISDQAISLLRAHRWSGNARELRNVIRQAALQASAGALQPADLRPLLTSRGRPAVASVSIPVALEGRSLKEVAEAAAAVAEKQAILEALRSTRGNKTKAAKLLEVDFKTLHAKMKKLGIDSQE